MKNTPGEQFYFVQGTSRRPKEGSGPRKLKWRELGEYLIQIGAATEMVLAEGAMQAKSRCSSGRVV